MNAVLYPSNLYPSILEVPADADLPLALPAIYRRAAQALQSVPPRLALEALMSLKVKTDEIEKTCPGFIGLRRLWSTLHDFSIVWERWMIDQRADYAAFKLYADHMKTPAPEFISWLQLRWQ